MLLEKLFFKGCYKYLENNEQVVVIGLGHGVNKASTSFYTIIHTDNLSHWVFFSRGPVCV